jgi:hypothetical protein
MLTHHKRLDTGCKKSIFWEGFGYTLKHFKIISRELDNFLLENEYELNILTNVSFARWGGYLGKIQSVKLVKKWFPKSFQSINIIPWTIENVKSYANKSDFAIIPIDIDDNFAKLKPENKLLGLWALGLPVLFSDTPAYKRVSTEAGLDSACLSKNQWAKALNDHDYILDEQYSDLAGAYLLKNHTKIDLVKKWENVIRDVLNIN